MPIGFAPGACGLSATRAVAKPGAGGGRCGVAMNDLSTSLYFAKIIECGSLSAAADALGVAKSVLSQHLAKLETDLGVRLIQRTTRKLQIADVGRRYYERCRAVLVEVERA